MALHFSFLGFWPFSINCQLLRFAKMIPATQCGKKKIVFTLFFEKKNQLKS
jgi:hypothetical protein